jgi:eukaryotic-like serine/threonine-protein kinase
LGSVFAAQGQFQKATDLTRQAVRFAPNTNWYANLAIWTLALQRFDAARQIIHEAQVRKLDSYELHNVVYALAFLGADSAEMAEQQQWYAREPEYENFGLALVSDTEAYTGHLGKARELTKRAVGSAIRADNKENGALWQADAALQQTAYGNAAEARQTAAEALKLAPTSQGVEIEAAHAFALAGDAIRAESLAQELEKRFPLDTQRQSLWLPAIRAQLALDQRNPDSALKYSATRFPHRVGKRYHDPSWHFLPISHLHSRRGVPGGWTGQCCRSRVPENSRPQRDRLELLDRSIGTSGRGTCECAAMENVARR